MPPPMGIRSVLKMSDPKIKEAWLRAYQKEIQTLIDVKTFALDKPKVGEPVIPTMETSKVKIKSDGSLDILKCRIVER
jgi:hypothetical protein